MVAAKRIIIIAGPNGAGKTTFAREYLPKEGHCPTFINADLIAKGLSPFHPDVAAIRSGRVMLSEEEAIERVRQRVSQGGHDVPEDVIRRRFVSGWRNFRDVYRHEVDEWFWYDNSNSVPVLIEQGARR